MTLRIFATHYRLDALAKRGGMGSVYAGTDLRDGSKVAIKLVGEHAANPGAAAHPSASTTLLRQRFARESAALAATSHPHIARYLDHGEQANIDFLVMAWVNGVTLRERLELGPLDDHDAVVLGQKLASALVHLAERDIVHRDIKPENIMLPEGNVTAPILVDLGIVQQKALHVARTGANAFAGRQPCRRIFAGLRAVRVFDRPGSL
jgi:eukaryotic-like serine/threonine-protein kinase